MKKFIKWFFGYRPKAVKPLLVVPVAPEWTADDKRQLLTFLKTPTGQAFLMKARAYEAHICVRACAGEYDPKTANGVSVTLNWIESLTISGESPAKDSNDSIREGDNGTADMELSYQ